MTDKNPFDDPDFGAAPASNAKKPVANPFDDPEYGADVGAFRSIGDSAVAATEGIITGGKITADAFGAGNKVSKGLDSAAKFVGGFKSGGRRAEADAANQRIADAEDSGSAWNEVKANLGAFAEAPIDTTLQALGTSLPTIAATIATRGKVPQLSAGIGGLQGAGTVKGSIYDAVEQEHLKAGLSPEEAKLKAEQSQSYLGDNAGQIALGAGLGGIAGSTGVESVASRIAGRKAGEEAAKGIVRSTAKGALTEAPLEALQGGQERLASNLALQNEGFDTETWKGVAGSAALEGVAGAAGGGAFGAYEGATSGNVTPQQEQETQPIDEPLPTPVQPEPIIDGVPTEAVQPQYNAFTSPPSVPEQYRRESLRPSERMGLNPNAGSLSNAAVIAVDGGAYDQSIAQAQLQPVQDEQSGTIAEQNLTDVQQQLKNDRTLDDFYSAEELSQANDQKIAEVEEELDFIRELAADTGWTPRLEKQRADLTTELASLYNVRNRDVIEQPNAMATSQLPRLPSPNQSNEQPRAKPQQKLPAPASKKDPAELWNYLDATKRQSLLAKNSVWATKNNASQPLNVMGKALASKKWAEIPDSAKQQIEKLISSDGTIPDQSPASIPTPYEKAKSEVAAAEAEMERQGQIMAEKSSMLPARTGKRTPEGEKAESDYYAAQRKLNEIRKKVGDMEAKAASLKPKVDGGKTEYARELEERRAIKEANVTSSTYERAQKRLMKQADGFISGRTLSPRRHRESDGDQNNVGIDEIASEVSTATTETHKDAGQPAEQATKKVVDEAIQKSASNTDLNLKEARAYLLSEIDKAIASAPRGDDALAREQELDLATKDIQRNSISPERLIAAQERKAKALKDIGYISFDVPGDGKFKVLNTAERLQSFRKKVAASSGFKDEKKEPIAQSSSGTANTGSAMDSILEMIADGERGAALALSKASGNPIFFTPNQRGGIPNTYINASPVDTDGLDGGFVVARQVSEGGKIGEWVVLSVKNGGSLGLGEKTKAEAVKAATERLKSQWAKLNTLNEAIKKSVQIDQDALGELWSGGTSVDTRQPKAIEAASKKQRAERIGSATISDEIRALNPSAGVSVSDGGISPAVAKSAYKRPESEVQYQSELQTRLRAGEVSIAEFKSAFASLTSDRARTTAELSALTKDKLIDLISGYSAIKAKSEKKDYAVRAAYEDLITQYYYAATNSSMFSYSHGGSDYIQGKIDSVKPVVDAATQENLDAYAKEYADAIQEREENKKRKTEGMQDPKTLEDFRNLHRAILSENENMSQADARMQMSVEQRAEYDRLSAIETRVKRIGDKVERKTAVSAGDQLVSGSIIETKHTKKGHDLFVVQLDTRVSKEDYTTLAASAKKLGGYYSSFKGGGAIPGFQFTTNDDAKAFLDLAGGNTEAASEIAKEKRDAFEDDKSQSTTERLRTMSYAMRDHAENELTRDRKSNTSRRAGMAARALESAEREKAMSETMARIADGIEAGELTFLDKLRTKAQLSQIQSALHVAKGDELRKKYDSYAEQLKHEGEPITAETVDYAAWPTYTAYRSDLAKLARQMIETDGLKKLGNDLLKLADDTSAEYQQFAKENLNKVATFQNKDGALAAFKTKKAAALSIEASGFSGKAIPLEVKRGEHLIILSPSEAAVRGIWAGSDKKITLTPDFVDELIEKAAKKNRKKENVSVPWQFETAYEKRQRYKSMGIETAAEFRAALREYVGIAKQPREMDKVKKLELAMVGRKKDGLDFFPTPQSVADEMINTAGIQAGMSVLEPSAGMGHIADRIRAFGVEPDVVEISSERRELLEAKGYNLVGNDFTEFKNRDTFGYGDTFRAEDGSEGILRGHGGLGSDRVRLVDENGEGVGKEFFSMGELTPIKKNGVGSGYDRIIMNPPFSDRRDMEHVLHAYDLLKPGGRIVAIVGEGVMFGSDKKATGFRDWLDKLGATTEKLEEGTFNDPSLPVTTGVNARMLVIDKPESGEIKYSLDKKADIENSKDSEPKQQEKPAPEKKGQESNKAPSPEGSNSDIPEILTTSKKKFLAKMASNAGLKKSSAGYAAALERLDDQYEDMFDKAMSELSFDKFNELNSESGEAVNRQAWEALREEFNVKFSFAGQQSNTVNLKSLASAKLAVAGGKDAEQVRQETGWFRGKDGKWRYEISDNNTVLKLGGSTAKTVIKLANIVAMGDGRESASVKDVIDAPELFGAYPQLANTKLTLFPEGEKLKGQATRKGDSFEIKINQNLTSDEIVSTILHESQHVIQGVEGWAIGGSKKGLSSDLAKDGADTYHRLHGEVEARNTQSRLRMTPEQRRKIAPVMTQDVESDEVIVSFNGKDIANFGSEEFALDEKGLISAVERRFPSIAKSTKALIAKGRDGKRGGVVVIESADPLAIASEFSKKTGRSLEASIQIFEQGGVIKGFYDGKSGLTFIIGPNVNEKTGPAVLLHEMIHGQQRESIDQAAMNMIINRNKADYKTKQFLNRVVAAMGDAGEASNPQEAAAYIVELAVAEAGTEKFTEVNNEFLDWVDKNLGKRVGDLIRSMTKAFRQWSLRNGLGLTKVTVGDLVAYAMAGVERAAESDVNTSTNLEVSASRDAITSTPAFKKWFGDSKVVDESGNPLVVYHGSPDIRSVINGGFKPSTNRGGVYFFSDDYAVSNTYADPNRAWDYQNSEPATIPLYLSLQNPMVIDAAGRKWRDTEKYIEEARAKGHDGIIIKNSRDEYNNIGNGGRLSTVYAVFEPKQIKSAAAGRLKSRVDGIDLGDISNTGSFDPTNPDIRFSRSGAGQLPERGQVAATIGNKLTKALRGKLADLKPTGLGALPLMYLREFAPKSMTAIDRYIDEKRAMDADRNEAHTKYDKIAQDWLKLRTTKGTYADRIKSLAGLSVKDVRPLDALMHDATIEGIDPSKPRKPLTPSNEYDTLKSRYDKLSSEEKEMFNRVRDAYGDQIKSLEKTIEDNIENSIGFAKRRAARDHKRELEQANDEFTGVELQDELETINRRYNARVRAAEAGSSAKLLALRQKFESMRVAEPYFPLKRFGDYFVAVRKDGKLLSYSMFESSAAMEDAAAQMKRLRPSAEVSTGRKSNKQELQGIIDPSFVSDIQSLVADHPNSKEMADQIYQLYLESMPDFSMRKGFIHRKKVAGYSEDAMRVFASSMFHSSYQIARLKHSLEMNELVDIIEEQAKESPNSADAMTVSNEFRKRHEWVMNPTGGQLAQKITSAAFVYQLGLTPAAAVVNTTQTFMMGIPILGTHYKSEAKATKELLKASGEFLKGGFSVETNLTGNEKKALEEFSRMGLIDKTQSHDLAGVGETGVEYSAVRHKVMGFISGMFHHAERFNREVTSLAAYRMAIDSGKSHESAIKEAADLTWKIHFDYSSGNRARFMQGDTAKVLLVFRQHSVNMLSRLAVDFRQALRGESKEVRQEAWRRLAGIYAMFGLMAGLMGVPGMQAAIVLLNMIAGDDEDPWTAEDRMKRYVIEALGEDLAEAFYKGVPGYMTGVSITNRIGMGDLWFFSPYKELEGRDAYVYWMEQALGAAPAMIANAFSGFQLAKEGQLLRGIETAMPKAGKDLMRAVRYSEEGVQSLNGYSIVDEVEATSLIAQALGFTPAEIAERYESNSALKNAEQKILNERRSILNRHALAVRTNDTEARKELVERIAKFNKNNPTYVITTKTIMESMKRRDKNKEKAEDGVSLNPKLEYLRNQQPTFN